jgi:hypothetical protein
MTLLRFREGHGLALRTGLLVYLGDAIGDPFSRLSSELRSRPSVGRQRDRPFSHLVQSTRAGADAGLGLAGVILFALVFKYPFFVFGPRYAAATGESLVEGYLRIVTADRGPPQYRPGPGMRMLSYTGLAVLGLVAVAFLAGFLI